MDRCDSRQFCTPTCERATIEEHLIQPEVKADDTPIEAVTFVAVLLSNVLVEASSGAFIKCQLSLQLKPLRINRPQSWVAVKRLPPSLRPAISLV